MRSSPGATQPGAQRWGRGERERERETEGNNGRKEGKRGGGKKETGADKTQGNVARLELPRKHDTSTQLNALKSNEKKKG